MCFITVAAAHSTQANMSGVNTEGLDPWEAIQLKTFLNWANSFILQANPSGEMKILDPRTEIADGLRLILLMESLTGESLGRYHKKPKMKVHMVENLNLALKIVNILDSF